MEIYLVQPGDSVDSIAYKTGNRVDSIIYVNQLEYPYGLAIGQALLLPISYSGSNEQKPAKREIEVNGYAYPFINYSVMQQTLPYLSGLFVFSYGFTYEGNLIPPELEDNFMIQAALDNRTSPVLVLTPLGPDGRFNNSLISAVVNNPDVQQNLVDQLVFTVKDKGFLGVDIDFEYILAEDRVAFADFVRNVRLIMNEISVQVSVALAPKTADDQPGLLYGGKDYALLGEAANKVLLMTYEWGYTYGPPMAVAPLDKVRQVVEYAITRIPEEKIWLGIPNYGYDWALPYERGVTAAESIGNAEAIQIAITNDAEIQFDLVAQSPYFKYERDGVEHEVWFEDVRSVQAKFGLVNEYGLAGMGYWQIMRLFRANWTLLSDTFWIKKLNVGNL